jgi:hypothetical protein
MFCFLYFGSLKSMYSTFISEWCTILLFFVSIVHFSYCHGLGFDCNVFKTVLVVTGSEICTSHPSFSLGC